MDITKVQIPNLLTITVRHKGSYTEFHNAFETLWKKLPEAEIPIDYRSAFLGIYWNNPQTVSEDQLISDAAFTTSEASLIPKELPEGLNRSQLAGGLFYSVIKRIPGFKEFGETWTAFHQELSQNDEYSIDTTSGRPAMEIYHSDAQTGPFKEFVVEFLIPAN